MLSPAIGYRGFTAAQAAYVPLRGPGVALATRLVPLTQTPGAFTCGPTATQTAVRYFLPYAQFNEVAVAQTSWVASPMPGKATLPPSLVWNDVEGMAAIARAQGLYARPEVNLLTPASTPTVLASALARNEVMVVHRMPNGDPSEGHFTAIDGVDAYGVHLADSWPAHGAYQHMPWAEFLSGFHHALAPGGVALRVSRNPIVGV